MKSFGKGLLLSVISFYTFQHQWTPLFTKLNACLICKMTSNVTNQREKAAPNSRAGFPSNSEEERAGQG